jgi:hypothetical protein
VSHPFPILLVHPGGVITETPDCDHLENIATAETDLVTEIVLAASEHPEYGKIITGNSVASLSYEGTRYQVSIDWKLTTLDKETTSDDSAAREADLGG